MTFLWCRHSVWHSSWLRQKSWLRRHPDELVISPNLRLTKWGWSDEVKRSHRAPTLNRLHYWKLKCQIGTANPSIDSNLRKLSANLWIDSNPKNYKIILIMAPFFFGRNFSPEQSLRDVFMIWIFGDISVLTKPVIPHKSSI